MTFPWLVISLLRAGLDTRAARFAREIGPDRADAGLVAEVARRLYPRPDDRRREVDRAADEADRALRQATAAGAMPLALCRPEYPELLKAIVDPPPVLWVLGHVDALSQPSVAIVGSRDAAPSSLAVARKLARELAEAGVTVVSGLARGVDGAAHAGALEGAGRTIAILGSGIDVVYPVQHQPLAARVRQTGAVVSELPPWARALPRHFPLRNRIISGLSRAVVVVEAAERSGSLITARMAAEQGRDVLAVPGSILSGRHRGSNALIKDGARLVETVEDVLEEIRWPRTAIALAGPPGHLPASDLEATMAEGEAYSVDELARETGQTASDVLSRLSLLELSGRVTRLPGGHFARLPGRR